MAAAIDAALKARVAALTFSPAIPVAWPNKDYTPTGERYLAVDIVPAPNQRMTLGGASRKAGSLVITVASRPNNGSGEGDGVADAVAAHFPVDLKLTTTEGIVRITEEPSIRGGFIDGAFWRTPVVIPFEVLK